MRSYLLAGALLLALLGAIGAYIAQRFAAMGAMMGLPPPVLVAAEDATLDAWPVTIESVGSVRALNGVDVTAEVSGEITEIAFESGGQVSQGDLLLVINDAVEQAARQSHIADLELAEVLYERDKKLLAQKSIPQTQYDRSRAELARARAALAGIDAAIQKKRIRAPISGTLGIRRVERGDYISPGTVICSLQDLSTLEIDFAVPGRFAGVLQPGMRLQLDVDSFPGRQFPAHVVAIDSRIDTSTRNLMLRARLDTSEGLLPGMFARVTLYVDQENPVVTVPETAITYSVQGDIVWVVGEDQGGLTAESRVVETGDSRDGRRAVLSGLAAGERVVSVGQNKLYRDVRIALDQAQTPAATQ